MIGHIGFLWIWFIISTWVCNSYQETPVTFRLQFSFFVTVMFWFIDASQQFYQLYDIMNIKNNTTYMNK